MQPLIKWLREYGLNPTEVRVYICILQNPEVKVADLQRLTSIVRTTLYYTLSELKSKGLISEGTQNNVKFYRANDTSVLEQELETTVNQKRQQQAELENLKPLLSKLRKKRASTQESYVARYEGVEPIKQALEQAFRCHSKRWHIIASRDNFLYHASKAYQQYYLSERRKRGITAKTLWEPTDEFRAPSVDEIIYRNPRLLPEEFRGTFKALVILYDNTTLIIDAYHEKTAHAIHNATSTNLLRRLHETVWKDADKLA